MSIYMCWKGWHFFIAIFSTPFIPECRKKTSNHKLGFILKRLFVFWLEDIYSFSKCISYSRRPKHLTEKNTYPIVAFRGLGNFMQMACKKAFTAGFVVWLPGCRGNRFAPLHTSYCVVTLKHVCWITYLQASIILSLIFGYRDHLN